MNMPVLCRKSYIANVAVIELEITLLSVNSQGRVHRVRSSGRKEESGRGRVDWLARHFASDQIAVERLNLVRLINYERKVDDSIV